MSISDEVTIREARREDCQAIINLSKEIANFHKHFNAPQIDVKVLEHDTFDVENPNMGFYVAVMNDNVIGYGHYYYTYTLRLGRNMCLQDLYVQEKFRNRRIGDKLMQAIAHKAIEQNIGKMEFVVTDWNPAKSFYKRMGALDITESEAFHVYQLDRSSIQKIASPDT
ncbi:diamine acetyltransferase 2-like isoform X2 [Copidosoma floridanum]|uniref:diamine acetyltransferase 2-like isoform X1 n=1 Tax=Copidosoma floridanum TaxID=29053 RepID=UPI0006C95ADF|nr:diamine acetyltransferase 2-like isoform X1 [Copidosoma floridanum]XP_014219881.1 diamine acetyltransferase 2-like isoform X2 [Copidosoma floridanum]